MRRPWLGPKHDMRFYQSWWFKSRSPRQVVRDRIHACVLVPLNEEIMIGTKVRHEVLAVVIISNPDPFVKWCVTGYMHACWSHLTRRPWLGPTHNMRFWQSWLFNSRSLGQWCVTGYMDACWSHLTRRSLLGPKHDMRFWQSWWFNSRSPRQVECDFIYACVLLNVWI